MLLTRFQVHGGRAGSSGYVPLDAGSSAFSTVGDSGLTLTGQPYFWLNARVLLVSLRLLFSSAKISPDRVVDGRNRLRLRTPNNF